MTREDAIKELKESLDTLREYNVAHSNRLKQALEIAIRTLENHDIFMKRAYSQGKQDALSQEPCDDAISRLDKIRQIIAIPNSVIQEDVMKYKMICEVMKDELPSVTQKSGHFIDGVHAIGYREGYKDAQKQKSGKWIHFAQSDDCSLCGYSTGKYGSPSKYCPNCGAKMESEE